MAKKIKEEDKDTEKEDIKKDPSLKNLSKGLRSRQSDNIARPSEENKPEKAVKKKKAGKKEETGKPEKESKEAGLKKEEKTEKEESKIHKPQKPHIKKRGKKYKEVSKLIDKNQFYSPEEAIDLTLKTSATKFDSSLEIHIKLGIKVEQTDQNIRTVADLPNGTGKQVKVAAIIGSLKEKEAKEAGADFYGGDDLISKIEKGFLDFDIVIATPDMMGKIGKLGKILGTKGLMPNPKVETVTDNPERVIKKIKKGRVEIKNDSFGIVHAPFGKVSFGKEKLAENLIALLDTLFKAKPQAVKGQFVKNISMSTTMGPSAKIDINKVNEFIHKK